MSFAAVSRSLPQPIHDIKKYAIIVLNSEGKIISWNAGAETILGYSPEEAIGSPFARVYGGVMENPSGHIAALFAKCNDLGYLEEEGWQKRKTGPHFGARLASLPRLAAVTMSFPIPSSVKI